jgi:hypothetical protein
VLVYNLHYEIHTLHYLALQAFSGFHPIFSQFDLLCSLLLRWPCGYNSYYAKNVVLTCKKDEGN